MKKSKQIHPLLTHWGESIDKTCPHGEYPRPQLKRRDWVCLNGLWQYAIRKRGSNVQPETYDGDILVPFSPESKLSGVERQLLPGQTLWYRREVFIEEIPGGGRMLLHFGAVDQQCAVYFNGRKVGGHEGGYFPFTLDITEAACVGANIVCVAVWDNSDTGQKAYGKQKLKRGGIWYTAQSGIWQTVWMETVPEQYIEGIDIVPRYGDLEVEFRLTFRDKDAPQESHVCVLAGEETVAEGRFTDQTFRLPLPGFRSWSPDDPFIYTVIIKAGEDEVESYFGMREFGITCGQDGFPRLSLNGEAIFHSGLLDQGYWSDGLYTAPSDEAIVWELTQVKQLGFNMLRKHIKIEPLRWYYHCDRLGLLVWQDFVNGGGPYGGFTTRYLPFIGARLKDGHHNHGFGRSSSEGRTAFERDLKRTVALLRNVVSIAVWTPFNEGWGQFDAHRITDMLLALDNTRLIDHASGWHDQRCGHFASHHVYYKPFRMKPDPEGRVQALTEFGGYSCPSAGHMASERIFGYRMYKNKQELTDAFEKLYRTDVLPAMERGLSAAIYTQLSDVEDEINGLLTYDRAELKLSADTVQALNRELLAYGIKENEME